MPKLKIEVTAEDIANGIRQAADSCPIALAIRRACPAATEVEVLGNASIVLDGVTQYARFPEIAHQFVGKFDGSEPDDPSTVPGPIEFEAEFEPRHLLYSEWGDEDDYDPDA